MPLVSYGSSGEESDNEDDNNQTEDTLTSSKQKTHDLCPREVSDNSLNLFSRLPPPKTVSTNSTSLPNSSLNDMIAVKPKSGPIKISIPSLKDYIEEEDEEDVMRRRKRFKGSTTGTGLSTILPKPKNTFSTTSKQLIPQSLTRPKPSTSATKTAKSWTQVRAEDVSSEEKTNYFFSDEKIDDFVEKEFTLSDVEFGPKPDLNSNNSLDMNSSQSSVKTNPSLDDMSYKRLIASKYGEEAPEDINIVDIDVAQHLSDSKDWLKTISEEKEEDYTGVQPSSTARRKHQITYLALQAKQREVALKNEWARSRTTKTQTRAKYGF